MSFDLVIFDDDCDVHFPEHFKWRCSRETKYIGYGGPDNVKQHWKSKNFLVRRLYKLIYTLFSLKGSHGSKNILVYDDIVFYLFLALFSKNKISLRLTHLKDYERMNIGYRNLIYKCLGRVAGNSNIFVISEVAKRYLRRTYSIQSMVVPSMVDRRFFVSSEHFNGNLVYSGTINGRNILPSLEKLSKFAVDHLNVKRLLVMAPEISASQRFEISELLSNIIDVELIEAASPKVIKEVYAKADFGIAFYDVHHNKVLKQNFPLKTLEYLASDIIPIANDIPAHRELIQHGFKIIRLDNYSNVLQTDPLFDVKQFKSNNRRLVNRLDQYFTINHGEKGGTA